MTWWDNNWHRLTDITHWLETSDPLSRQYIYDLVKDRGFKTILEAGPGLFADAKKLKRIADYEAIDQTEQVVSLGKKKRIRTVKASIEEMPYKDGAFQIVYARHVVEHLPDFRDALREMIRVAEKCVVLVFFLLDEHSEWSKLSKHDDLHQNTYSQKEINAYLDKQGVQYEWTGENDKVLTIFK